MLQEWRDITADMYPDEPDLLDGLPNPKEIDVIRLLGGMLSHDTYSTAQLEGFKLADVIIKLGQEAGLSGDKHVVYQG